MKSHRPERVANVVRQAVSDAIASKLNDPRISTFASVTRVEMSADLEHARVWVSVLGRPAEGRRTLAGLRSAAGLVQRMLARELTLRHCPHLTFELDESIKKGAETIRLINEAMAESKARESQSQEGQQGELPPGDDA